MVVGCKIDRNWKLKKMCKFVFRKYREIVKNGLYKDQKVVLVVDP